MRGVKKCDSPTRTTLFAGNSLSACNGASTSAAVHHLPTCSHSPIQGSSRKALGHLGDVDDFEFVQLIGRGFFGTVWKVREKHERGCASSASDSEDNHGILVMKVPITYGQLACHSSVKKIIQREDFMLRRLQHPNILRSRGLCIQRTTSAEGPRWQLNLLIDYCDAGSLQQLIVDRQRPFSWLHRSFVLRDVCKAMNYVHSLGYMHRDLTSMNVLLQSQPSSKFPKALVADFGLSCRIPRPGEIFQQAGTSNWMSPEMLREEFYNEKSDVFSFGVIACQCFARIDADYDTGLYRTPQFGLDYVRFAVCCPPETPLVLLKIAFMCCLMNPDSRPSFKSLERQFKTIIGNWELAPHNSPRSTNPEDIKLERSRSDAAILRGHLTTRGDPDLSSSSPHRKHQLNPKRKNVTGNRPRMDSGSLQSKSKCEKDLSLEVGEALEAPDGERSRRSSSRLSTPAEQIKELAVSVANIDPSYEESCENPFARHSRYRSVRKMKPPDSLTNTPERRSATFSECHPSPLGDNKALCPSPSSNTNLKVEATIRAVERLEGEEDADAVTSRPRSRSFSLPSSVVLDDGDSGENVKHHTKESSDTAIIGTPTHCSHSRRHEFRHVLLGPTRKNSLTFDTGDERDLRGRMPLSFRDYDQQFNSNYSNTAHRHRRTGKDAPVPSTPGTGTTSDFSRSSKGSPYSSSTSYDTVCSIGAFEADLELTAEKGVLKSASEDADRKSTTVKNGRGSPLKARRFMPTIPPPTIHEKSILRTGGRYSHKQQTKSTASPTECRSPSSSTSTNNCCLM